MPILRKEKKPICGIYCENEFRALVEYERKRADRTGDGFSIVLFDISNSDEVMNQADWRERKGNFSGNDTQRHRL